MVTFVTPLIMFFKWEAIVLVLAFNFLFVSQVLIALLFFLDLLSKESTTSKETCLNFLINFPLGPSIMIFLAF